MEQRKILIMHTALGMQLTRTVTIIMLFLHAIINRFVCEEEEKCI